MLHLNDADLLRLSLALFPYLRKHNLTPPLSHPVLHAILTKSGPATPVDLLPAELVQQIGGYLQPAERIAWLLSDQRLFWGYLLPFTLDDDTASSLRRAAIDNDDDHGHDHEEEEENAKK